MHNVLWWNLYMILSSGQQYDHTHTHTKSSKQTTSSCNWKWTNEGDQIHTKHAHKQIQTEIGSAYYNRKLNMLQGCFDRVFDGGWSTVLIHTQHIHLILFSLSHLLVVINIYKKEAALDCTFFCTIWFMFGIFKYFPLIRQKFSSCYFRFRMLQRNFAYCFTNKPKKGHCENCPWLERAHTEICATY